MEQRSNLLQNVYMKALFPGMVAILGGTVNVFVDGILVGQRMGEMGLAAVNQSLAVYLLLCTVGSLFAAGASVEVAHAMGKREVEKGKELFSMAMETYVLIGVLVCALGLLFLPGLSALLGSPATVELIQIYLRITLAGGIFKVLLYIPYYFLRLEGMMGEVAVTMVVMTVTNIVLDYLFLFPFHLGIAGAALASALATAVACVMSFWFLFVKGSMFRFRPVRLRKKDIHRMMVSGSPIASNNLFSAIRVVVLNSIMNLVGGSSMVAVFAITNNLNEFSICIQNGVPQTGSALLGVYHGESDPRAVKRLLWLQLKMGLIISVLFSGVMILFSGKIGALFGTTEDVRFAVICWAVSVIAATGNEIMSYYYFAIRNSTMANLITVLRVFAVISAVAWCMKGLGDYIWLFYPVSEILSAVLWMGYGWMLGTRQGKRGLYLLKEDVGNSIDFVVRCDPEEICGISAGVNQFCEENGLDEEQTMTLSLAMEELMMITAEKTLKNEGSMDVRILKSGVGTLLRIRAQGEPYNPLEHEKDNLDFIGVQMIVGMAKRTEYQSTLGLNTLIVEI